MRHFVLIILLVSTTSAAFAQPTIDHMSIDEMKGQLSIFGTFGTAQGKVWVDSVEIPVVSWVDTIIVASIPDSGRGSTGPVIVKTNNSESNARILTTWKVGMYSYHFEQHSRDIEYSHWLRCIIRMDLHSMLINNKTQTFSFIPNRYSSLNEKYDFNSPWEPRFNSGALLTVNSTVLLKDTGASEKPGFACIATFDLKAKSFSFVVGDINGIKEHVSAGNLDTVVDYPVANFGEGILLNNFFEPIDTSISKETNNGLIVRDEYQRGGIINKPPPSSIIAIRYSPSIISPHNDSKNLGTDNTLLIWDSLRLIDRYHLQLSLDSSFVAISSKHPSPLSTTIILDTTVSSLQFALFPLEKNTTYFWRIAGVNSEGQSKWSDIWHFETGSSAAVLSSTSSNMQLNIFPNPSSNEIHINYSLPLQETVIIKVYDLLGREVRNLTLGVIEAGEHSTELQTAGLHEGSYVIVLRYGSNSISRTVIISRP